jgi:hypothetical protein
MYFPIAIISIIYEKTVKILRGAFQKKQRNFDTKRGSHLCLLDIFLRENEEVISSEH